MIIIIIIFSSGELKKHFIAWFLIVDGGEVQFKTVFYAGVKR